MQNQQAIGIFDSGLGGLSVWKELIHLLPNESFIYYADSANCPYGEKTPEQIKDFSSKITDFLIAQNCKLIVVACNTATTAAITYLRNHYNLPFIGIEPAIKPAALNTKTGKIGVIATKGTLQSDLFYATSQKYAHHVEVIVQIGEGLVELVEAGKENSKEAEELLEKYIEKMTNKDVDQIVLGCTHYPFLIPLIDKITKKKINIINPAIAVAKQTKNVLLQHQLENNLQSSVFYKFYTSSEDTQLLKEFVENIKPQIENTSFHHILLDAYFSTPK